jgi:hypothetical protein
VPISKAPSVGHSIGIPQSQHFHVISTGVLVVLIELERTRFTRSRSALHIVAAQRGHSGFHRTASKPLWCCVPSVVSPALACQRARRHAVCPEEGAVSALCIRTPVRSSCRCRMRLRLLSLGARLR